MLNPGPAPLTGETNGGHAYMKRPSGGVVVTFVDRALVSLVDPAAMTRLLTGGAGGSYPQLRRVMESVFASDAVDVMTCRRRSCTHLPWRCGPPPAQCGIFPVPRWLRSRSSFRLRRRAFGRRGGSETGRLESPPPEGDGARSAECGTHGLRLVNLGCISTPPPIAPTRLPFDSHRSTGGVSRY
jgi:hypothetical protein